MPSKPLSAYNLFYRDKFKKLSLKYPDVKPNEFIKIIAELFKNLADSKKEKYQEKARILKEEYIIKLKQFYEEHPEEKERTGRPIKPTRPLTPFKIFYNRKLDKHKNDPDFDVNVFRVRCRHQWKSMSDKKKAVWIKWTKEREEEYFEELEKFSAQYPDYDISKLKRGVLSKEEKDLLDRIAGKPRKPPNSGYRLFMATVSKTSENMKSMNEIAALWRELPEIEKKEYNDKVKVLQMQYALDNGVYLKSLTEEQRQELITPKKKNLIQTKILANPKKLELSSEKKTEKQVANPHLYKNEPAHPPKDEFEYYCLQLSKKHPKLSDEDVRKKATVYWSKLNDSEKKKYKAELKPVKKKYIQDYTEFLNNLNDTELAEYSAHKRQYHGVNQREIDDGSSDDKNDSDSSANEDDNTSEESD